jgi:putative Holliday junction resolvase
MKLLGIDFGTKRIGVAVSDEFGWTAQALCVINRHGGKRDLEAIARLVKEQSVGGIVFGLPLNMNGTEGESAAKVRKFVALLEEVVEVPIYFWDERLTTWEAEGILIESKVKPKKRRQVVDKLAAALILDGYLKENRTDTD